MYNGLNSAYQPGILKPRGTPDWYASGARFDLVTNRRWVAPGSSAGIYVIQPSQFVASAVSYVTGSHNIKAGYLGLFHYDNQQSNFANDDSFASWIASAGAYSLSASTSFDFSV